MAVKNEYNILLIMKKRLIISALGFAIFFTLFRVFSNSDFSDFFAKNACHTLTERIRKIKASGIVMNKYLDKKSHMHETIIINSNRKSDFMVKIPNELSGLYEFVEVGDSLFKEEESLEGFVKRDSVIKKFEIDFGCK